MLARLGRSLARGSLARRPRPSRDLQLGVEAGQVVCPNGGIVDIEACYPCSRYRGRRGSHDDRLVCAVDQSSAAVDRILVAGR